MFVTYLQNNSGGFWHYDEAAGIGLVVIVEAPTAEAANERAESIGLYFDGCHTGRDCWCCGARWDRARETECREEPMVSDIPVEEFDFEGYLYPYRWECFLHRLDGSVEKYGEVNPLHTDEPTTLTEDLP